MSAILRLPDLNRLAAEKRSKPDRYSLRWRLLITLSLIFLLTFVVIGIAVYSFISRKDFQTWQGRQQEAASSASQIVSSFIERTEDTLAMAGLLHQQDSSEDSQVVSELLQRNQALLEIIRLGPEGQQLSGAYQDRPILANTFTIPQSAWFLQARSGQPYFSGVQISPQNEPYIIMAIPAADGGVVAARLRMTLLWDLMEDLSFGQTGQSYVLNKNNQVIAHTDPAIVLNHTNLARRIEAEVHNQILDQEWLGFYTNFQGQKVSGVTSTVPGTDLVIITEVAEAEVFASSRQALQFLTVGLVVTWIITLSMTSRNLERLILQPLEQLQLGTRQIGEGNLDYRLKIDESKKDEMTKVAKAFNQMAGHLNHHTHALKESEERFRRVVNSISDHIYATKITRNGVHINLFTSPNVFDLTGYPAERIKSDWNLWPSTLIHPDDRAIARAQMDRFAQGQNSSVEYRLIRADGDIVWVRDSGRVERDPTSQEIVVYAVVSDISAQKETEQALRVARDEAMEANKIKSELLARVSHELRTPLGAILGFAEILNLGIYGEISNKQKGFTQQIIKSTHTLTTMVSELLDQARLEAGMLLLDVAHFQPVDVLENLQVTARVLAEKKGLELTTELAADVPLHLVGDAPRLLQILNNLTGNAIKFTEEGSVHVRIFCPNETQWALQVSDTGPGISEEAQALVFDPFRQLDGSITRRHGGSGLGLSIVKKLSELMGGEVFIDSEEGRGSTFTVVLPLKPTLEMA